MVDNVTRDPGSYLRHIEDFFGDARSTLLVRSFPKETCFHIFIQDLVASVIWESANSRYEVEVEGKGLWIDRLIEANDDFLLRDDWETVANFKGDVGSYLGFLSEIGVIDEVCELVSQQVFHVLFANRGTLQSFGRMVSDYVSETAHSFAPEAFTLNGQLKRTHIKKWAKDAVFHRDKGRCVLCTTDLTKIYSKLTATHFDHIVPLASGGLNCVTNLQLCCDGCNLSKGARSDMTSLEYEPWF